MKSRLFSERMAPRLHVCVYICFCFERVSRYSEYLLLWIQSVMLYFIPNSSTPRRSWHRLLLRGRFMCAGDHIGERIIAAAYIPNTKAQLESVCFFFKLTSSYSTN